MRKSIIAVEVHDIIICIKEADRKLNYWLYELHEATDVDDYKEYCEGKVKEYEEMIERREKEIIEMITKKGRV